MKHRKDPVVQRTRRFFAAARAAARRYDVSVWAIMLQLIKVYRRLRRLPEDVHQAGLSNPRVPSGNLSAVIAKKELLGLQFRLNPKEYIGITEDKAVFDSFCRGVGLPCPRLYCVVDHPSWTPDGSILNDAAALGAYLCSLEGEIIIKPARGVYGLDVRAMVRTETGFRDSISGECLTPRELAVWLWTHPWRRLVVQERVRNHAEIIRLTGQRTLQTVRVQGLVTRDFRFVAGGCHFKIGVKDQVVDNIAGGKTGNFSAAVCLEDGRLSMPVALSGSQVGAGMVEYHPESGHKLKGYRLPYWAEVKTLARRAALLHLPVRTIGWDIAITDGGPILVEGNPWWDPGNELACCAEEGSCYTREMGPLLAALHLEAEQHGV